MDVDIIFRVEEKRTGNINFGASLGQGTGIGGFLGLEEPNLFGQGKRGKLQWQFGQNINDFNLSYTDPAIRESRISGTISLFDSRPRYTVGDLGRRQQTGGCTPVRLPAARLPLHPAVHLVQPAADQLLRRVRRPPAHASAASTASGPPSALSVVRDTRIGLPFATGGSLDQRQRRSSTAASLGGDRRLPEARPGRALVRPPGHLGGGGQLGGGVQFVLGLTAKSGFIFGDAGPVLHRALLDGRRPVRHSAARLRRVLDHARRLRPAASGNAASPDAFGESYAAFTVEAGARVSQSLYVNIFFDAGNVYRTRRASTTRPGCSAAPASASR